MYPGVALLLLTTQSRLFAYHEKPVKVKTARSFRRNTVRGCGEGYGVHPLVQGNAKDLHIIYMYYVGPG